MPVLRPHAGAPAGGLDGRRGGADAPPPPDCSRAAQLLKGRDSSAATPSAATQVPRLKTGIMIVISRYY